MKKLILKILLTLDVLAIIVFEVCSVFLRKYDWDASIVTDGFGRVLKETPKWLRAGVGLEEWAGFGWAVADGLVVLALIGVAYVLREKIWVKK